MNWFTTAHGAFTQSMTLVTAYDSLGVDGLRASLHQTKSTFIFLDSVLLPTFNQVLKDCPDLKFVVYNDESKTNQDELDKIKNTSPNIRLFSYEEFLKLGEEGSAEHVPPKPTDLACVMYTSGTSGTPKGVTIKHESIVAASKLERFSSFRNMI